MKFLSQLTTMTSGSVNGLTASHNRSGQYFRAKVVPVNPSTINQQVIRNAFSELSIAWLNDLSQAQRDGWDLYADNVPVTDKLGQSINLTGQNMYIRSNVPRLQFDQIGTITAPRVDEPPTIFTLAEVDPSALLVMTAPNSGAITFNNGLAWANENDAFMFPYSGRPVNASINFFGGPYRLMLPNVGDGTTPPTSPGTNTSLYAYAVGQQAFSYARISRADGRLSPIFKMPPTIVV